MKTLEERFWKKVEKTLTCWLWLGCKSSTGYGQIQKGRVGEGLLYVHRLSWQLHFGLIPEGLCVLHRCDVRECVNPEHLWLGSCADNNWDREKKKRGNHPGVLGERNGLSKLTQDDVIKIRSSSETQNRLAEIFGVSQAAIWHVLNNRTWVHVI